MILGRTHFQHVSYSTMKTPFVESQYADDIGSTAAAIKLDDFVQLWSWILFYAFHRIQCSSVPFPYNKLTELLQK